MLESRIPAAPADLQSRNPLRYMKYYGPGAIVASVSIGSGETIFASRGGAIFGYSLIWCLLLGALFKVLQVYSSLRFVTLSGIHPVDFWARMPGPRAWFPKMIALISIVIIPSLFSAIPKFMASLIARLQLAEGAPGPSLAAVNLIASVTLLSCALLALRSSYYFLEQAQSLIIGVFLVFVVATFVSLRPDFAAILGSFFIPSIPSYPEWVESRYPLVAARPPWVEVMTYVGILGGSSTDYLAYLSFMREKKWGRLGQEHPAPLTEPVSAEEFRRGRLWLRAPLTDCLISFSAVVAFTVIFMVLGAVLLAPEHLVPANSEILTVQARFLTTLSPLLYYLYVPGILMVFIGTIYGAVELHTRALYECARVSSKTNLGWTLPRVRRFVVLYAILSGLILIWIDWDPVLIVTPASILGGVLGCGLWCFAMLWTDRRFLPKAFQMGLVLRGGVWIAGIVLSLAALRAFYDFFFA